MTQIKLRRDTAANFTSKNPVLGIGEPAYETDTKKLKIGDGTTAYTQLEYFSAGGGGSAPTNMVTTDTAQTITGLKTFGGADLSKILLEGSESLISFQENIDSLPTTLIGGFFDSNGKKSIIIGSTNHETLSLNAKSVQDGSGNEFLTSGNVTAYVTEEFVDGTEGYRVWSNKYCEQWGTITNSSHIEGGYGSTVTLLKPYKDASYQVYTTAIVLTAGEGAIGVLYTGRTTTQFSIGSTTQYTRGVLWKAEGYIA